MAVRGNAEMSPSVAVRDQIIANAGILYSMINCRPAPQSLEVITMGTGTTIKAAVVLDSYERHDLKYGFMRGKDAPSVQLALDRLLEMATLMLKDYWKANVRAEPGTEMVEEYGGWYNKRQK
ncbi:hypothetical protein LTR12_013857 [Friedmanniomyces endolithicus]|nr:hypothetical protein LTR12_013857 [Friedmanniomyces endolithicus]